MAGSTSYDAIALEVELPGIDGLEACRRLRADDVRSPVLMLSVRDSVEARVAGLDGGADDHLIKPFHFDELAARLRALMRRGPVERSAVIEVGDLRLDPATCRVWRGSTAIELSAKPFALLAVFMRRPHRVLSRFALLEHAWDGEYENRSNVVDVHVAYLRDRIDRPSASSRWKRCADTATGFARSPRPGTLPHPRPLPDLLLTRSGRVANAATAPAGRRGVRHGSRAPRACGRTSRARARGRRRTPRQRARRRARTSPPGRWR
jgi:two-component system OmpR family response regulator